MKKLGQVFANIFLAEEWTPGKQIGSVFLLLLLITPLALLYVFQSQVMKFIVFCIKYVAQIFGVPMEG